MKRRRLLPVISIIVLIAAIIGSWTVVQGSGEVEEQTQQTYPAGVKISETYSTPRLRGGAGRIVPFANGTNTSELVYFTPQDLSTNTTILFLYNTGDSDAGVQLEYYTSDGSLINGLDITLPPYQMGRFCGDNVYIGVASWQQNTFEVDFGPDCAYAAMMVPYGVRYSGYVAWNDTEYYNPMEPVIVLPLEFYSYPYLSNGSH